jgi:cell division septal protein FtsQ
MRRRRLRNAPVIFLVIALMGTFGYFVGWSKALEIRSIEVSAAGNEALVTSVLIPKDLHLGLPMARLSTQRITHDLSQFTWIRSVTVTRRWLAHDVKITIRQRIAVAQYVDSHGSLQYFDASGFNFTVPNPPAGIPTIDFSSESVDSRSAVALFLSQTPRDITTHLSSLAVDSHNQIAITTTLPKFKNLSILWGSAEQLSLKNQVLRQLLSLPENKKISSVDLSLPMTPVVK